MIGSIRGIILEKQPPQILLESYGLGYEVYMPMTCFCNLPDIGKEALIFTHYIAREDSRFIFGFTQQKDRMLFREMIKVTGIGPKIALAILSRMSATQFIKVVKYQEVKTLMRLPGIGRKTAERLMIEMRDQLSSSDMMTSYVKKNNIEIEEEVSQREAIAALITLGYKLQEATEMISKVARPGADCAVLVRDALREEVKYDRKRSINL